MTEAMSVNRHQVEEVHTTLDALYGAEKRDRSTLVTELKGKMDALREIKVGSPAQIGDATQVIEGVKATRKALIDEARAPLDEAEGVTQAAERYVDTFDDVLVLPRTRDRCGKDGCGGSCGQCSPDQFCHDMWCRSVPECAGKNCGEDGSGGLCGRCAEEQQCPDSQVCDEPTATTSCSAECDGMPRGERETTDRDDYPGRYRERLYEHFLRTPDDVDTVIGSSQARYQLNQRLIDEHTQRAATIASKEQEIITSKETLKTSKADLRDLQKTLRAMTRQDDVSQSELTGYQERIDAAKAAIGALNVRRKALAKELSALKATHRRQEPVVRECRSAQPDLSSMNSRYTEHVAAWRGAIAAHLAAQQAEVTVRAAFIIKLQEIKRSVAEPLAEAEAVLGGHEVKALPDEQLATLNGTSDIHGLLNTPVIEGAEQMIAAVTTTLESKRGAQQLGVDQLEQYATCTEEGKEAQLACAESCAVQRTDEDIAACQACIIDELPSECEPEALDKLPSKDALEGYKATLDDQVATLGAVAPLIPALTMSDARCRALRRAIVAERDRYGVE
jgi:hypothetical protein